MKIALEVEIPEGLQQVLSEYLEANPMLNQNTVMEAALAVYLANDASLSEPQCRQLWSMYWDAMQARPAQAWQVVGAGV